MYKQHGESSSAGASSSDQLIPPSLMFTSSLIAPPREPASHKSKFNARRWSSSPSSQDSHVHNRYNSYESSSAAHNDSYPNKRWRPNPHRRTTSSEKLEYVDGNDMPVCEKEINDKGKDKESKRSTDREVDSGKVPLHSAVVASSRTFSGTSSYRKDNHAVNSPGSVASLSDTEDSKTSMSAFSDSENNQEEITTPITPSNTMLLQGEIYDLLHDIHRSRSRHNTYAEKAKQQAKIFKRSARNLERKLRTYAASLVPTALTPSAVPIPTVTSTPTPLSDSKPMPASVSSGSTRSSATITKHTSPPTSGSSRPQLVGNQSSTDIHFGTRSIPFSTDTPSNSSIANSNSNRPTLTQKTNISIKSQIGTIKTRAHLDAPDSGRCSTLLPMKPRCLLLSSNSKFADLDPISWGVRSGSNLVSNLIAFTTIYGDIQFWNGHDRRVIANIPSRNFGLKIKSEDAAWLNPSTLIMDIQYDSSTQSGDVILIHITDIEKQAVQWRSQQLGGTSPHGTGTKGISQLEPVQCRSNNDGGQTVLFATGGKDTDGKDNTVVLWSLKRPDSSSDYKLHSHDVLHTMHTSTIQGFCIDTRQQILWSCGADRRLVKWDLTKQTISDEAKLQERINSIAQNPIDPNLLLLSNQKIHNQLSLVDARKSQITGEILQFGYKGSDNISRYLSPAWHPDGYLVAMGHQSEGSVNIWDIRYTGLSRGPAQTIPNLHTLKVLRVDFSRNKSNTLVSCSSDRSISFTDYTLE